jgi:outer membrane immunogenic protein
MRISVVSVVAAAISAAAAQAADMPIKALAVAAPYDWSGFYIGAVAGQGWTATTLERISGSTAVQNTSATGAIGGIDGGSRFQVGKFVFGADADIMFGDQKGHTDYITTTQSNVNRTATLTAVGGAAHDNWLLYAKAGIAWAKPTYTDAEPVPVCFPCTLQHFNGLGSDARIGWTVGAGIEWAFWQSWSLKLEYDYIDLMSGEFGIQFPSPSSVLSINDTTHIEQLKLGLRWKFLPQFW